MKTIYSTKSIPIPAGGKKYLLKKKLKLIFELTTPFFPLYFFQ